ncbi:DUF2290 domain-containing protein [Pseudovibrio ascidiaceicola]|uniref:DUF2290 domain-containing protein n=1 Tax=Pseudovibrio ascidiaceicola TaxID=285279 RepID=UPI000D691182|nr:DUF2290 domain-containing protein [Pseudovibrio ascidiaceicola]
MRSNQLNSFISDLIDIGLVFSNKPISEQRSGRITMVSVGQSGKPTKNDYDITDVVEDNLPEETSIREYTRLFENGFYSLLFHDGSLAQLSYSISNRNGDIIAYRYVYIPAVAEIDVSASESPDIHLNNADLSKLPRHPVLRFEFDPDGQARRHPESHLHLSSNSTRIPVNAKMTPRCFIGLIIDYYYEGFIEAFHAKYPQMAVAAGHLSQDDEKRFHIAPYRI